MSKDLIFKKGSSFLDKLAEVVWYVFYIIGIILTFRFVLILLGANETAQFTKFIYGLSYPFAAPFSGVIDPYNFGLFSISWNTLLAMVVYWVIAWILIRLILLGKPDSSSVTVTEVREEEKFEEQDEN